MPIHVNDRLLKKFWLLARPDIQASDVVGSLQGSDVMEGSKTSAKISRRRGIGNARGAQGVQKGFVIATQFDVLQASAFTKGIVGQIEHVIGFVIGQMEFEQMKMTIDGIDQS
jgi:hypothetical protein